MRFSVVTPAFNAERFLPEMLHSLKSQSYSDWELRIVDDCSTDSTRSLIEHAATSDSRIKPLFLDRNSGNCFLPRRLAMEAAEGEYVVNIDADDTVEPDYILKIDRELQITGADIVYCDVRVGAKKEQPTDDSFYNRTFRGRDILKKTLDGWHIAAIGATRRQIALDALSLFDNEFPGDKRGGFDNEILSRLDIFLAGKVAVAPASYFYRMVDSSVTHSLNTRRFELLDSDILLRDFVGRHYGTDSDEYVLANAQLFHHVIELIRVLNRNPRVETLGIEEKVRRAFKAIDLDKARGQVSPRYLALMRLGFNATRTVLKVYPGKEANR